MAPTDQRLQDLALHIAAFGHDSSALASMMAELEEDQPKRGRVTYAILRPQSACFRRGRVA